MWALLTGVRTRSVRKLILSHEKSDHSTCGRTTDIKRSLMQQATSMKRNGAMAADLSLMRRVAAADRHAQRVLAHRLAPRVQRISQRLLRNRADADDASQVALIEILRSAATYQ